jgi:hypothetical protein
VTSDTQLRYFVLPRDFLKGASAMGAGAACLGSLAIAPRSLAADPGPVTRQDLTIFQESPEKVAALEAVIGEMQDRSKRDPSDPKGWLINAQAHADYCAKPGPGDPDQIHYCWWFLSWHRAYLAVTERKLRELSGDASIAFPYWSNDRVIPPSFTRTASNVVNAAKESAHAEFPHGLLGIGTCSHNTTVLAKFRISQIPQRPAQLTRYTSEAVGH